MGTGASSEFVAGEGAATAGNSGLAEALPALPGAAGKIDALASVEPAGVELQAKHNVSETMELKSSSRRRVGMSAQLSQPALAGATGGNAAGTKRTEPGRRLALPAARDATRAGRTDNEQM
jgi:hypothetical protein